MNPSRPPPGSTNGWVNRQEVNFTSANDQILSRNGAGSSSQPRTMEYPPAWPVTTSAHHPNSFAYQAGPTIPHQPANSDTTEAVHQYSSSHAVVSPVALGGAADHACNWYNNDWQQTACYYGNPAPSTGLAPTSHGTAVTRTPFNQGSGGYHPMSTNVEQSSEYTLPSGYTDDRVECPYRCGTILTGIHAVGNLTRHLKSKACPNSPRSTHRHTCPVYGCGREYARSDGLKVHMRRHHGAPPAAPKYGAASADDEGDYEEAY